MGHQHWNARRWHRKHARPRRRNPTWAPALVVALAMITGGVAATQSVDLGTGSEQVGICHATGDAAGSFLYLVVDRDGEDHQMHSEHEDDIVGAASATECPLAGSSTTREPVCHEGHDDAAVGPGGSSNATHDNATDDNATAGPDLCSADVAADATAEGNGTWVRFAFDVQSLGPGEANDVRLQAKLPDVGQEWHLVGSAPQCGLQGRELSCEFGDLVAGQNRSVTAKAARCADDCGDDLEATMQALAYNDGNATNDEATAVLVVADCPREAKPAPTPTQTSGPTPTPTNGTGSGPNASQPRQDNGTGANNQTSHNQTQQPNGTQAPRADVSTVQRAQQDADHVALTIVVRSVGDDTARNVTLRDDLPDVRRTWSLTGADAAACTLDARWLNCWFSDLAPGESRTVQLKAYTDRLGCGHHLTNNATASADNDTNNYNDRSGASIEARSC